MSNKDRALAIIRDRIEAAEKAGLPKTADSFREYYRVVAAKADEEIIISSKLWGAAE